MVKTRQSSLDKSQRDFIADKLMDSANAVLAVLVIGQLVTDRIQHPLILAALVVGQFLEQNISWPLMLAGAIIYLVFVIYTTKLQKGGGEDV